MITLLVEIGGNTVEGKDLTLDFEGGRTATDGHHLDGVLADNEDALSLRHIYRQQRRGHLFIF